MTAERFDVVSERHCESIFISDSGLGLKVCFFGQSKRIPIGLIEKGQQELFVQFGVNQLVRKGETPLTLINEMKRLPVNFQSVFNLNGVKDPASQRKKEKLFILFDR